MFPLLLHGQVTVQLDAVADQGGRYYDFTSDAFFEVGLQDPGSFNPDIEGSFSIVRLPLLCQWGAEDVFPNNENFELGYLQYDDSTITNIGTETAPIVGLDLDIQANVTDGSQIINAGLNNAENSQTIVLGIDPASEVVIVDGVLKKIFLAASVRILYQNSDGVLDGETFDGEPDVFFDGTFSIFSNRFDFFVDGFTVATNPSLVSFAGPNLGNTLTFRFTWDFTGTFTNLEETPFPEFPIAIETSGGNVNLSWTEPSGVPPMFIYVVQSSDNLDGFPWPESAWVVDDQTDDKGLTVNLTGFSIYGRGTPGGIETLTWTDPDTSLPAKRYYRMQATYAPRPSVTPISN